MVPTADEVFAAADLIAKVTVEQGGCIETSRPTTHSDPTFVVTHYCVANILGAVAQTSTLALTRTTTSSETGVSSAGDPQIAAMRLIA